ncbi:serine protease [Actinomyces naeslundii]|uniref:Serine protease n=1 Tax=Actinomyces naeslundii TaxID=1655 RepID=A0ABX3EZK8_ACTNA|nr:CAP domain-containing protein [Actinomyces naeslundii]OLO83027.1 serine protease [Actinomyces naeslundii]OLO88026.1 serine protease [Actinomyces naeslundii]OLO90958.1 serine protease [Actinomyces naeslundii]OLO93113.1 serine protease [Actinomyces naeslundii]OMG14007.1 serine protease [Actinomyces naeslundii]
MNIKRVIAAAALTVVPLTVSSTALAAPAAPQGAPAAAAAVPAQASADGAQYANTVLNKVNELRSSLGLQPVTRYQELDTVAQDWSEQQAAANNMSHRPDFTSAYPAGWTTGSENVAWRTAGGDTGALIFDQWLNSPGHYKNMTDPNVNSIGIGFAQTSDGRWYATQNFAAYNVSNTTLTQTTSTTSNTTTTTTNTTTTNDTPPSDTPAPQPTPETTSSTPTTETTPAAPVAPPATETTSPAAAPTPSAPATTVTTKTTKATTSTGTPAKPSSTPAVAAPKSTPTKSALATTGPSIAIAVVAAGLLGTGSFLVMRRRQAG